MELRRLTVIMLAAVVALAGLALEAKAGGDEPDCLVTNKSLLVGRDKMTGTAVVELTRWNEATLSADAVAATLTLKFHGQTAVFTANFGPVVGTSPEAIVCDAFAVPAMTSTNQTIFDAFSIPTDQTLALCQVREEKAGAKGTALTCLSVVGLDLAPVPNSPTGNFIGTADLTVFIIPAAP